MATIIEVYKYLDKFNLLQNSPKYWWPNSGTFEVVISAILTQNTTWKNVERSLKNLEGYLSLESFVMLCEDELKQKIRPSGFYNQKASRLLQIARNIQKEFGDFITFQKKVDRKWLLAQKGIGKESADAILCYGCKRDTMVIDSYTKKVLQNFGIVYKEYDEYRIMIEDAIIKNWQLFTLKYENKNHFYCCFHGMFVEYNKKFK